MKRSFFLSFLLATLAGTISGWIVAASVQSSASTAAQSNVKPLSESTVPERAPLISDPQLDIAPDTDPTAFDAALNDIYESGMYVVPREALSKLGFSATPRSWEPVITNHVRELLALTEEEVSKLNAVFAQTSERLNTAELRHVEIVEVSDNKARFHIPGLGEISRQIKEDFHQEIFRVLGQADGEALINLLPNRSESPWDEFGEFSRTITFSVEDDDDGNLWANFRQAYSAEELTEAAAEEGRDVRFTGTPTGRSFGIRLPISHNAQYRPSLGRSASLLPFLPESLRKHFQAIEEFSNEHKAR